ncbi:MAG: hypothetical protein ABI140_06800 [Jatrophihabitantaceae bacterium]
MSTHQRYLLLLAEIAAQATSNAQPTWTDGIAESSSTEIPDML